MTPRERPPGTPLTTLKLDEGPGFRSEVLQLVKAPHRPVLVVMSGNEVGRRARVEGNMLVGRDPSAELVLTDAGVSWHHARIEDRGDELALIDLGSTNGTSVNGVVKPEYLLEPNDKIVIGRTLLRFEVQDGAEQAYDELVERLLNVDDLSGLLVRRKFDVELDRMIDAARVNSAAVGLLVMDLDGIKKINDTHGHLFGAYTIGESGRILGRVIGARGIACRFGGDENLAALPEHDLAATEAVGTEILEAIRAHRYEREGVVLSPGISVGVGAFPESGGDREPLFQRADEALYRAKQAGKNRVMR